MERRRHDTAMTFEVFQSNFSPIILRHSESVIISSDCAQQNVTYLFTYSLPRNTDTIAGGLWSGRHCVGGINLNFIRTDVGGELN